MPPYAGEGPPNRPRLFLSRNRTAGFGVECDLIEAHKWFNLAAGAGHGEAQLCRADISDEMTAREIAEAQRRAREWLSASARRAA